MIRTEGEYKRAVARVREEKLRLNEYADSLKAQGLSQDDIEQLMAPVEAFHEQLVDEVGAYERLKNGDLGELGNLRGLPLVLIGLRIACGVTQRELAKLLGVAESQVSRDERNEYRGVTVEKASRIFDVLDAKLTSHIELQNKASARSRAPENFAPYENGGRPSSEERINADLAIAA